MSRRRAAAVVCWAVLTACERRAAQQACNTSLTRGQNTQHMSAAACLSTLALAPSVVLVVLGERHHTLGAGCLAHPDTSHTKPPRRSGRTWERAGANLHTPRLLHGPNSYSTTAGTYRYAYI
jgi:hypothetical protein